MLLAVVLLLAPRGGAEAAAAGVPQASAIRVEAGDGGRTRLVVEFDRVVAFRTLPVADPLRLIVDLPEVEWRLRAPAATRRGLVTAEHHGLFGSGRSRLVLDLAAPFRVARQALEPPPKGRRGAYRLVIDIEPLQPIGPKALAAAVRPAAAAPTPQPSTARLTAPSRPPAAPAPKVATTTAAAAAEPARGGRPPPVPLPRPAPLDVVAAARGSGPAPAAPPAASPPAPAPEAREAEPAIVTTAAIPRPAPAGQAPPPPGPAQATVLPLPGPPTVAVPPPAPGPAADLPVVVVDPGHGGIDPGAIGVDGTLEKDVVLELGRALRDLLEATGRYRVVLTRGDDSFVRLRERIARAREANADLFVSLHADSLGRAAQQRGASVYTLSETASDEEAERLANKENKSDVLASTDLSAHDAVVTSILIDLAQRETNNRSIGFAELLAEELAGAATLVRRRQRSAGFAVLKSPDIPSVLIEIGYLSNPEDARNLAQAEYRAGLAGAVLRALDRQFGHTKS